MPPDQLAPSALQLCARAKLWSLGHSQITCSLSLSLALSLSLSLSLFTACVGGTSLSVGWLWNSASLRVWQCRPGPSPCGGRGTRSLSVGGSDSVVELDAGTLLSVAMAVLPVDQATDLVAKLQVDIFYLKILSAPTVASFTGLRSTLDVRSEASSPVWDILGLDVKALTEASEDPDVRAAVGRFASLAKDNITGKRLVRELRQLSDERSQRLAIIREVLLPLTGQEIMKVNIREYPESVCSPNPLGDWAPGTEHLMGGVLSIW